MSDFEGKEDSFDLDLDTKKDTSLHNIGLSTSSDVIDQIEIDENIIKTENTNKSITKQSINEEVYENEINIDKYDKLLKELSTESQSVELPKVSSQTNDNLLICREVSKLVSKVIPESRIPADSENQKQFIISTVQKLVDMIENTDKIPKYQSLLAKYKKREETIIKLQEKCDQLYDKVNEYKVEIQKISSNQENQKDLQIAENIKQIAKLVEIQKQTQKKLLKETKNLNKIELSPRSESRSRPKKYIQPVEESDSSDVAINIAEKPSSRQYENEEITRNRRQYRDESFTNIRKMKRIPYPETSSSDEISSDLIIMRAKPNKITKITKVHGKSRSKNYRDDLESDDIEPSNIQRDYSKLGHKVNKLIGITNKIQDDFKNSNGESLSLSHLSMLHESLLEAERKLKK